MSMQILKLRQFLTIQQLKNYGNCRSIVSTVVVNGQNTAEAKRKCKLLSKFLGGNKKKKWYSGNMELGLKQKPIGVPAVRTEAKVTSRRAHVLNALFMEHITDVMSVGDIGYTLQGYGIEITRVKVTSDYTYLNVYWLVANSDIDKFDEAEKLLFSSAGEIRYVLSTLRLMGHIPKIVFVREKSGSYLAEIERLLAIADFGPDESDDAPDVTVPSEKTQSDDKRRWQLQKDDLPPEVPDMRQDIYGLNHSKFMKDVLNLRKKTEAAHRNPDCPYLFHEIPKSTARPDAATIHDSLCPTGDDGISKVKAFMKAREIEEDKLRKQKRLIERELYKEIVVNDDYEESFHEADDDRFDGEIEFDHYKRDT